MRIDESILIDVNNEPLYLEAIWISSIRKVLQCINGSLELDQLKKQITVIKIEELKKKLNSIKLNESEMK